MPRKQPSPKTALLPHLSPTLSLPVHHSTAPWPSARRTLHLHGPVILLSRAPASPCPSAPDKLVVLRAHSGVAASGARSVAVTSDGARAPTNAHKLRFDSPAARDAFVRHARAAVAHAAAPRRYQVLREIGHGPSAAVYLVERRGDGTRFAMKAVEKAAVLLSPTLLARIVGERVALADACERDCAFIVRLVDAFETPRHLCFVTELAEYGDLGRVLRAMPGRRFEEGIAKSVFSEIVCALEETHRMGYLYRDMKLENVLLTKDGHVRLADFGLAKRVDMEYTGSSSSSTSSVSSASSSSSSSGSERGSAEFGDDTFRLTGRTKSFVGTRRYMSPEHLKGSRKGYGAPADMWALGVTLYAMLTGSMPFAARGRARNAAAVFHAIEHKPVQLPAHVSGAAADLVRGLLRRDAARRLTIADVKAHAWVRDVDWAALARGARAAPSRDVLDALRRRRVAAVDDDLWGTSADDEDGCVCGALMLAEGGAARVCGACDGELELLGFAYCAKGGEVEDFS